MNRVWSYLTLLVSRLLDSKERDIALGDVAELGLAGGRAFAAIQGLVVRRQLQSWKQTRAWFVLLALLFPLGTLLAFSSNKLSAQLFPPLIMWTRHHGTYATGVTAGAEVFGLFVEAAAIMLGSWSCGYAVGALSRSTRYVDGLLFCATLIVAMSAPVTPFSIVSFCCTPLGLLPVMSAFLLVLTPAFYGLRRSAAGSTIQVQGLLFLAIGTGLISVLTAWVQGWGAAAMENWSKAGSSLTLVQLWSSEMAWEAVAGYLLAIILMTSPVLYLLADQVLQRTSRPSGKS